MPGGCSLSSAGSASVEVFDDGQLGLRIDLALMPPATAIEMCPPMVTLSSKFGQ